MTKKRLQAYMAGQIKARSHSGAATAYNDLRVFWRWFAAEEQVPDPMDGIPRPRLATAPVPVLTRERLLEEAGGRHVIASKTLAETDDSRQCPTAT